MTTDHSFDVIVIGAGIAGASVAAELASKVRVLLLEMESQPGYHTTGRSAAIFAPTYGPAPIRALTRASEGFFLMPPEGFTDTPLLSPRGVMMVARQDQTEALSALLDEVADEANVERLDAAQTRARVPLLREGYAAGAMLDNKTSDIDVHALHQGFLRSFKTSGGDIQTNAEVTGLYRHGGSWQVATKAGDFSAGIVINAAGAWAEQVGILAGAEKIGLIPKRRTALMIPAPDSVDTSSFPLIVDIEEQFYLKPDAGRLLISPANEDPETPCDVQPDEMDIALCIDRIETAFDLQVRRIENRWAGLRSFVSDKSPVAGFSKNVDGFFWLAGQGGYGIQSAPALSRLSAALVLGRNIPDDILAQGLDPTSLAPDRPGLRRGRSKGT